MSIGKTQSRNATAADVRALFGKAAPQTIRARVLVVDGKPAAIAGYYMVGPMAVMFSDIKDDAPKMTIWREAKKIMAGMRIPAICLAEETSGPFLKRLGWVFDHTTADGDIYRWQHCSQPL